MASVSSMVVVSSAVGRFPLFGLLPFEVALHLLQSKVGGSSDCPEGLVGPLGLLVWKSKTLAFADHAVLEVADLHDTRPLSVWTLAQLGELELEQSSISRCCLRW
jgi:hypothetical protein